MICFSVLLCLFSYAKRAQDCRRLEIYSTLRPLISEVAAESKFSTTIPRKTPSTRTSNSSSGSNSSFRQNIAPSKAEGNIISTKAHETDARHSTAFFSSPQPISIKKSRYQSDSKMERNWLENRPNSFV